MEMLVTARSNLQVVIQRILGGVLMWNNQKDAEWKTYNIIISDGYVPLNYE